MRIRYIIFLMVVLLATTAAQAQTHYEGRFSVGGKAGATFSKINFSPSVPQQLLIGMTIGGAVRYIEEKHFGLIAEFSLTQGGWREKFEESDYNFRHRLTYLQIPVLTHVYFGSNTVHGFLNAGPQIGFMIADGVSSNFDYTGAAGLEYFNEHSRHIEQYSLDIKNRFDYGITVGVGLEVLRGRRHSFALEGRFYYGLSDIFSNHKADTFSGSAGMSFMVTLGYFYHL